MIVIGDEILIQYFARLISFFLLASIAKSCSGVTFSIFSCVCVCSCFTSILSTLSGISTLLSGSKIGLKI
jgi:hypothetical protein